MTQTPTIGRQVHYRMNAECAIFAGARRILAVQTQHQGMPIQPGAEVVIGDYYPATITQVHADSSVNMVVQLDGPDTIWVSYAAEGGEPGQWIWPPRA